MSIGIWFFTSYLLFGDNVFLFGVGFIRRLVYLKEALGIYNLLTRMKVNMKKLPILLLGLNYNKTKGMIQTQPFHVPKFNKGVKDMVFTSKLVVMDLRIGLMI